MPEVQSIYMNHAGKSAISNRPNLFIVGSMKCGTTILFDFLTSHPDISGCGEKELHYFSLHHDKGDTWYLDKFSQLTSNRFFLDASPTYFDMSMSIPTAERIRTFNADAKIIILIRNPIVRALSHFNHLTKINKLPSLTGVSFDSLISRRWSPGDNSTELESTRRMLIDFSLYESKVRKFIDVFGKDNVMLINNDDLRSHGTNVVSQVFDFLELPQPAGSTFTEQRYLHGTEEVGISDSNYVALLNEFGDDYYRSCRLIDCRMPSAPDDSVSYNQPIGALVNGVGVGRDGWLFLATGSNNVLETYLESERDRSELCRQWHEVVRNRKARLESYGARYVHMLVPEKISILGDRLGWPMNLSESRGRSFNTTLPEDIRHTIVDLIGYMGNLPDAELNYFKTDSHWNYRGAFVAYQLLCAVLGFDARPELLNRPRQSREMVLDLGEKLPDRPSEIATFAAFRSDSRLTNDAGLVRFKRASHRENDGNLHVGSFVSFSYEDAPRRERVIIFGDSFSEYRDHLLTGLLAETFAETTFVWSTSIDYTICEELRPDIVLFIMTERFMGRVPDDRFNLRRFTEDTLATLEQKRTQTTPPD